MLTRSSMISTGHRRGSWIIIMTFGIACILNILPMPIWAEPWRPAWIMLTVIYWSMALPHRVGVFSGWLVGLVQDALAGTLLGYHALGTVLTAWFSMQLSRQVYQFHWQHQSVFVFLVVFLCQLPAVWVRYLIGYTVLDWSLLSVPLSSALLWYWIFVALNRIRRTYNVH